MNCIICGEVPIWSWTDTHGIAQCRCGAPYRIFHYDENNKRVKKPPETVLGPEWIERCRSYRAETKRTIPSGCSFPGGQELASPEDIVAWNKYWDERAAAIRRAAGEKK